jgi:hypothetical protein
VHGAETGSLTFGIAPPVCSGCPASGTGGRRLSLVANSPCKYQTNLPKARVDASFALQS